MICSDCDKEAINSSIQLCKDCIADAMVSDPVRFNEGICDCGTKYWYTGERPDNCSGCINKASSGGEDGTKD